jgi:hypothetical protein
VYCKLLCSGSERNAAGLEPVRPVAFALDKLTAADEARIRALVKTAVS